jgi:hypothetical protein
MRETAQELLEITSCDAFDGTDIVFAGIHGCQNLEQLNRKRQSRSPISDGCNMRFRPNNFLISRMQLLANYDRQL